jgi:hypothetical protein
LTIDKIIEAIKFAIEPEASHQPKMLIQPLLLTVSSEACPEITKASLT